MAETPKKDEAPRKKFRLRDIFRRKAKRVMPPIPAEVLNDKRVKRAILHNRRKKWVKGIAAVLLASTALSTGLQFHPELVSKPYDRFMAEQGYPSDLKSHFHAAQINVYDRDNPLYPFHMAGNEARLIWHEAAKKPGLHAGLALETPLIYADALFKGFGDMIAPQALDAYSVSNNDPPDTRVCFMRPPADFSIAEFFRDFSNVDSKDFKFRHSEDELKKVLFEYVMLHEARHCDQNKMVYVNANESDADIYALRVLQARGTDPGLLKEAATIIAQLRSINAVMGGDSQHASTFALIRGGESIFSAHQDAASYDQLRGILQEAANFNRKAFPADMPGGTRVFYLTAALYDSGLLDTDAPLKRAAASFINATIYFDKISGGKMIDPGYDLNRIDLRYLVAAYRPVPDKLQVPAREKQQEQDNVKSAAQKPRPLRPHGTG
jgi:hypothetical protein